jgi:hypothetical protein
MPYDFIIKAEQHVVFSRGVGVFTHAEYLAHISRLQREVLFHPEFDQIVDCRLITKIDITSDQIAMLANMSVFAKSSRRAFVVSSDLNFGLSRMLATQLEVKKGQQTRVFRDMQEALSWLNLPLDLDPFVAHESRDDTNIAS